MSDEKSLNFNNTNKSYLSNNTGNKSWKYSFVEKQ